MDARENDYSADAMREFVRDTIANINGIYYVVSMDPRQGWVLPHEGKDK